MTDEAHARRAGALDRILELSVLVNADMTQSLARDQLTVSRAHVLWELRHRGPSTQRVLADAMGVSARTITGLVDGLVATGFVTREPHPTDRRATLVTVTEHGARSRPPWRAARWSSPACSSTSSTPPTSTGSSPAWTTCSPAARAHRPDREEIQ
ncbi:MarR family winged helix-turn-helix transcriptional regulator [Luedemannella flava]